MSKKTMTREQLAMQVGLLIGAGRRASVAQYVAGDVDWIRLRYNDVRDWEKMRTLIAEPGVEISDGEEWLGLRMEETG